MSTTLPNTPSQPSSQPLSSQFASIQIADALIKFSLYLQKLTTYQQQSSLSPEPCPKCPKLVRLILQTFLKYQETQQFAKQSYDLVKSCIIAKKSYYCLIVMDLMLKNSKYVIKQVKKQLEAMMRVVWEKVGTETGREEKFQNLKVLIKCWGFIFGDRVEENLRKWLQNKYAIKRIQLTEENQKALRQAYGEKFCGKQGKTAQKQPKISEALIHSLIEQQNLPSHNLFPQLTIQTSTNPIDPRLSSYARRQQTSFGLNNPTKQSSDPQIDLTNQKSQSSMIPVSSTQQQQNITKKSSSLEGMNKSLLEALDLS